MSNSTLIEDSSKKYAVEIDAGNPFYGWVFWKHPDGQYVSVRKAYDEELSQAKRVHEADETFKVIASILKINGESGAV